MPHKLEQTLKASSFWSGVRPLNANKLEQTLNATYLLLVLSEAIKCLINWSKH